MKAERKNKRGDTARANGAALKALRKMASLLELVRACRVFNGAALYDSAADDALRAVEALRGGMGLLATAGHASSEDVRARAFDLWLAQAPICASLEAQARASFERAEDWAKRRKDAA